MDKDFSHLSELNESQLAPVLHEEGPMIVVAGGYGSLETSEYWQFTVPGSKWKSTSKSFAFLSFSK